MAGMHRDKCGAAAVGGFFKVRGYPPSPPLRHSVRERGVLWRGEMMLMLYKRRICSHLFRFEAYATQLEDRCCFKWHLYLLKLLNHC